MVVKCTTIVTAHKSSPKLEISLAGGGRKTRDALHRTARPLKGARLSQCKTVSQCKTALAMHKVWKRDVVRRYGRTYRTSL